MKMKPMNYRKNTASRGEIEEYESVRNWKTSLEQSALSRGKPLTKKTWRLRINTMKTYSELMGMTPDELVTEDVDATMKRLTDYFLWMTGREVEGVETRSEALSWNSACTLQSVIRGFYTHNDLVFPKRFKVPKRKRSEVSKRDSKTPVFEFDEENGLTQMNGLLNQFVSNLSFRDQTIAVCLLSTGADAADLLSLNIGFLKDGKGQIMKLPRIPWHGNRLKDAIEFKTYFSKEATICLKRYVEQDRIDAGDEDPIFVKEDGEALNSSSLSDNFRLAAERMGYVKPGQANPFRPKRFRHAFREACSAAHIDEGYAQAMMGHSSGVSAGYLEKGEGSFLREYTRVEPFVTLFALDKNEVTDLSETLAEQAAQITDLEKKLAGSNDRVAAIFDKNQTLEEKIEGLENKVKEMDPAFRRVMKALELSDELEKRDTA